ncbi:ABC transporter substrate-binding protein, partial [Candidatus Bathyarchaeota archaeon]
MLSKNDTLSYIAPPGIDPHMYQLTPRDVEKLKTSSLIISTSHVPFEIKIKELVNKGIIKAKLIEIPFIPNIKLKKNPALNQSILHMPIYDPNNYKTFIFYLANILAELNPKSALEYKNNAKMVLEQVNNITLDAPKLNVTGVGDFPFTPYAVSWLNLTISYLVVKEWGIPPTPKDLLEIEEKIKEGKIKIAVVTKSKSTPSKKLENLAKKYEIPILYV